MRLSHLSSGPHPLVYFLVFSQDPLIFHRAAKCFSFPGGSNGQKDRTISILLPWLGGCPEPAVQPGQLSLRAVTLSCPDSSFSHLLFQVGQKSVLFPRWEAPVDRPP